MMTHSLPEQTYLVLRSSPAEVEIPDHGIWVLESHHDETFQMARARWPFHKLCWVAMGCGALEYGDARVAIERGQFLLLPAGIEHCFVDDPTNPLTLVIMCMDERFFRANGWREKTWGEACAQFPPGTPCRARSAFQHAEMVDRLKDMLGEQGRRQAGWELAAGSAADDLLVHVLRSCVAVDAHPARDSMQAIDGVIEYLDANFYKPVQLSVLAERCGLSPRRFTDLFKRRAGRTLTQYLNERRIEFARTRLLETEHILYSCYESGFKDVSYFYRIFKRHSGMTPGEFLARENRGRGPRTRQAGSHK